MDGAAEANKRKLIYSEADFSVAEWMLDRILQVYAGFKRPNLKTWANDIRLMRDYDDRDLDDIREVFAWANADSFWSMNILSPAKLRKHFDRLCIQRNRSTRVNSNGIDKRSTSAAERVRAANERRRAESARLIDTDDNDP